MSAKFDMSANTGNKPTVSFKIDDGEWMEKEISETLELATDLSLTAHEVLLFVRGMSEFEARWTPPVVASTTFLGFTVAGGNIVPTPRPERLKVEFLGDSITEGVALHAQGPQGQDTPNWRTDGPRGYAALTADQGAGGQTFAPLYLSFLGQVRAAYPKARIAALRPFVGAFGTEISAQVAARKAAGDSNIYYVDTAGWTAPGDFTDGVHPNVSGSVKISEKLVVALSALPK